jgi:hypothetical protein
MCRAGYLHVCKRYNERGLWCVREIQRSLTGSAPFKKEDRILQDQMIRAVDHPGCEQRTKTFTWCSACKQGFSEEDYPSFDFTQCPVCGTEPLDGYLPWIWVQAQWRNQLPGEPVPGVRYEASPTPLAAA